MKLPPFPFKARYAGRVVTVLERHFFGLMAQLSGLCTVCGLEVSMEGRAFEPGLAGLGEMRVVK
jgi:hypothetical protein